MTGRIRYWQRRLLDRLVSANQELGLDRRAESFVRLFENHLPETSRVLDIGGGWGFYKEPFLKRGHHLTVLDIVKPGLQKSPVVLYDGNRIPFPDKSFDISLCITVLHHIDDLEKLAFEAHRVTRKLLIVVEDLYHHRLGRWWTVFRDQIYNLEFFGHPKNFKKRESWIDFFEKRGFFLVKDLKIYTWLAGMRILNGVFIFRPSEEPRTS